MNTSYWRSNFYIIPDRPPGKDYNPPLLPGPNEDTKRGMTMHIFFSISFHDYKVINIARKRSSI